MKEQRQAPCPLQEEGSAAGKDGALAEETLEQTAGGSWNYGIGPFLLDDLKEAEQKFENLLTKQQKI